MRHSLLILTLASACASTAPGVTPRVQVAQPGDVASCERVGTMNGIPGLYGVFAAQGIADARRVVLEGAAEQGANTVVFDPIEPGETVTRVTGRTYRC